MRNQFSQENLTNKALSQIFRMTFTWQANDHEVKEFPILALCLFLAFFKKNYLFFIYFIFILFIYLFLFVVNFVIHWNETSMGLHVFPIPIPPPTSLSTRSP